MTVLGIDYSTFACDFVLSDETGQATWKHYSLGDQPDAFDRCRQVRHVLPARTSSLYDEVCAIGIEEPMGQNTRPLNRVQGAILSCLPAAVLVHPLRPMEWRKAVGLAGNCSKEDVARFTVRQRHFVELGDRLEGMTRLKIWPQDACDAYCIALAVRSLLETREAA